MKLRAISRLGAGLALIVMLVGCDRQTPVTDDDLVGPNSAQSGAAGRRDGTPALVEPHRYMRLSDLARALRDAGHSCEAVRTYELIEQSDGMAVYRIDCLEYSFRLTIQDGKSSAERMATSVGRQ